MVQTPPLAQPQQERRPVQQPAAAASASSTPATRQRIAAGPPKELLPRQTGIAALLRNGHDVRRGIIISEILGKPLALRH